MFMLTAMTPDSGRGSTGEGSVNAGEVADGGGRSGRGYEVVACQARQGGVSRQRVGGRRVMIECRKCGDSDGDADGDCDGCRGGGLDVVGQATQAEAEGGYPPVCGWERWCQLKIMDMAEGGARGPLHGGRRGAGVCQLVGDGHWAVWECPFSKGGKRRRGRGRHPIGQRRNARYPASNAIGT